MIIIAISNTYMYNQDLTRHAILAFVGLQLQTMQLWVALVAMECHTTKIWLCITRPRIIAFPRQIWLVLVYPLQWGQR